MDFFAHQDAARRASKRLVWFFVLAVGLVVAAIVILTDVAWSISMPEHPQPPLLLPGVGVATIAFILGASLLKTWELRAGGAVVAEMLGGRRANGATDQRERQLINVVEEMALASGTPMPQVYVLPNDPAINAFAAGHQIEDAVVAVTRGTLEHLPRHELQGVIAHEFSHILNGDMRLNLRLMGMIYGLQALSEAGSMLLRGSLWSSGNRGYSSSSDRKKDGGQGAIIAIGLALLVIGAIGAFAGSLIRAAISRRREFLADASAVQFTRDPSGIGGALKRIGTVGSRLTSPRAGEVSHFLLGEGASPAWVSWLASHPPLNERIRRIDPSWDGSFPEALPLPETTQAAGQVAGFAASLAAQPRRIDANLIPAAAGQLSPAAVSLAAAFLADLPTDLRHEAATPVGARAVALAVLCDPRAHVASIQLEAALRAADALLVADLRRLRPTIAGYGPRARLPLMDLAAPALRQLATSQRAELLRVARLLAWGAGEPGVAVFTLFRHLELLLGDGRQPSARLMAMPPLLPHAAVVLAHLAEAAGDETQSRQAFAAAAHSLGTTELSWPTDRSLTRLGEAIDACRASSFGLRRRIVNAAACSVAADGTATLAEAELVRLLSSALGCPLPPFAD